MELIKLKLAPNTELTPSSPTYPSSSNLHSELTAFSVHELEGGLIGLDLSIVDSSMPPNELFVAVSLL